MPLKMVGILSMIGSKALALLSMTLRDLTAHYFTGGQYAEQRLGSHLPRSNLLLDHGGLVDLGGFGWSLPGNGTANKTPCRSTRSGMLSLARGYWVIGCN